MKDLLYHEIENNYHKDFIIKYLKFLYPNNNINSHNYDTYFNLTKRNFQNNKLHYFKKRNLDRLKPVLSKLNYFFYDDYVNHLDVGFNRGTSLYEILNLKGFHSNTIAIDIDEKIVNWNKKIFDWKGLDFRTLNILNTDFADNRFEVVTCLEVLEHIEKWEKALQEIIRLSNKLVILSVPSKEDDNPEHINLLTKDKFIKFFVENDLKKYEFKYVLNHLIVFVYL